MYFQREKVGWDSEVYVFQPSYAGQEVLEKVLEALKC
jgi:hypothetical protein